MHDLRAFKAAQWEVWQTAAPGWQRWYDVLETPHGGGALNATIVEGARLSEGDAVLDVGSGYGQPGLAAARAVGPTGRVVLTDVSSEMLVAAGDRADREGLEGVECVVMDGDDLDFDPASFDAVISRHGLQFLADVPAALQRLHALLKTEGRFSATVWGPAERVGFQASLPVFADVLDLRPPAEGPGPNALSDVERLTTFLRGEGFGDIRTGVLTVTYELESAEQTTRFLLDLVPQLRMMTAHLSQSDRDQLWARVNTEAWGPFVVDGGVVRLPCQAICHRGEVAARGPPRPGFAMASRRVNLWVSPAPDPDEGGACSAAAESVCGIVPSTTSTMGRAVRLGHRAAGRRRARELACGGQACAGRRRDQVIVWPDRALPTPWTVV